MTSYLLDTNHAAKVMGSTERLHTLITQRGRAEDRFFISITVLGELYYAAYASSRQAYNLQNIDNLLNHIPVLGFDAAAAQEYGRIKAELKTKGRPIPGTDAQIAAVARLHDLVVLSADRHFQHIDNLQVEIWM
jgi:tRNA(fMet)-specific endonuclease VapC